MLADYSTRFFQFYQIQYDMYCNIEQQSVYNFIKKQQSFECILIILTIFLSICHWPMGNLNSYNIILHSFIDRDYVIEATKRVGDIDKCYGNGMSQVDRPTFALSNKPSFIKHHQVLCELQLGPFYVFYLTSTNDISKTKTVHHKDT